MKIVKALPLVLNYAKLGRGKIIVEHNDGFLTAGISLAWLVMGLVVGLMVARAFAGH